MTAMRLFVIVATAAASITLLPDRARADDGEREHDGLFLRVSLGGTGLHAGTEVDGMDVSLSGPSGQFSLTVGAALTPRFVLAAEMNNNVALGPTLEVGDVEMDADDGVTWGVHFLGINGTDYYRHNLFLSGSAGLLMMTVRHPDRPDAESDLGFAGKLMFGKEWWVSPNWSLGGAVLAMLGHVPDDDVDEWTVYNIGLQFNAVYN